MSTYYKALRKDMRSHWDGTTDWRVGKLVEVANPNMDSNPCGRGVHASPTLLDAVSYQHGPSVYCEVELIGIIASDKTKARARAAKTLRVLEAAEVDALAGFKLHEANNAVHPLHERRDDALPLEELLRGWASVRARVGASVGASVRASVWDSVWDSVRDSVWASVGDSVWDSVRDSVWASLWSSVGSSVGAYTGGLFPGVTKWRNAPGTDPWRPLLTLWYGGYVPSFDGETWRLHAGPEAEVVWEWRERGRG